MSDLVAAAEAVRVDMHYQDDEAPEVRSGQWAAKTVDDLEFCLRRLGELEREISENEERAAAQHERIDRRLAQLNDKLAKGAAFFRSHAAVFAENHRGDLLSGKSKTRNLLYGRVAWRKSGGGLVVVDEKALLVWAHRADCVTIKTDMVAVREWVARGNATPPGTERTEEIDKLTITAELTKENDQ